MQLVLIGLDKCVVVTSNIYNGTNCAYCFSVLNDTTIIINNNEK